jgi:hypothetical protein
MSNTEKHVKDIRRKTRRKFSSEEKIRIVLDGLRPIIARAAVKPPVSNFSHHLVTHYIDHCP